MITPILEKYLLEGSAKNRIYHMAFSSFAKLEIPADSFIVVHKIYWNGWVNQKDTNITNLSWKQFFNYIEYALKIQSDKEAPMFYQFRNEINFDFFGVAGTLKLLNEPINTAQYDDFILMTPKKPVIFDTWITSYDYLNFTLTRNALDPVAQNFSTVNNFAEETPVPNGIAGQNILLTLTMASAGTTTTVNPATPKVTPAAITPDNTQNYQQRYAPEVGTDLGSFLDPPLGGTQLKYATYVNQPLISFEYCIIQKNAAGKLSAL